MIGFVGHLHPLLVHLPIGFLVLGAVFYVLSHQQRYASLQSAVVIAVFLGAVAAFLSSITGYVLSLDGADDGPDLYRHQNLALVTTALSTAWFYAMATDRDKWMQHAGAVLTMGCLIVTGHLGAGLTHGKDYLWGEEEKKPSAIPIRQPVKNLQDAVLYTDLIKPLLEEKCTGCHGAKKQKGKLRLDGPDAILKGGEDGAVVTAGNAEGSDLIRRINLPATAKAHMPPRDKLQLTADEIALLHFWVQSGLSFDKRMGELSPGEKEAALLRRFTDSASRPAPVREEITLPEAAVNAADPQAVEALRKKGVVVLPVALNSNYLKVNLVSADSLSDSDMQLLVPLKEQLIWLNLGGKSLGDASLRWIGKCSQLRRLDLRDTKVTDKGMRSIAGLQELAYLNISATQVSTNGLRSLSALRKLRSVYLYHSSVPSGDYDKLRSFFPQAVLDTGGYQVPVLASDTTVLK
jgi:uncharacterized membrane protein/mono/diheme cytochrome c family protein